MSVINILMQLRKVRSIPADAGFDRGSFWLKVCNHPDLFETRPTISPFIMNEIVYYTASLVVNALEKDPLEVAEKNRVPSFCPSRTRSLFQ